MSDKKYLDRAYEIAYQVDPHKVAPGVRVGCVIVKDKIIMAEGVYGVFGEPHAEVNAFKNAQQVIGNIQECTVYITLEPCDCFPGKKTGSCTDFLIQQKPKRIVIGALDPTFGGKSIDKLRAAGIETIYQESFQADHERLNPFFSHYQQTKKPWITLKIGQSLDGRITACDQYITNKKSLVEVHKMRAQYSAMLTTTETIIQDDPRMNTRLQSSDLIDENCDEKLPWPASDPILIILGKREIPQTFKVWDRAGPIYLFQTLDDFLESELYANLDSIMTECGSVMNTCLLEQNLVDEVRMFVAPKVLGAGKMATTKKIDLAGFYLDSQRALGGNLEFRYTKSI